MDVPVELSRILITELGDQQVIFLREKSGERNFPILIGIAEALAIDRRLKQKPTPRPMTHELLGNVIGQLGARIEKVVISDIINHTFIARLHLERDGETIEVDSRPSDAIALTAGTEAPLFVASHVFDDVLSQTPTAEDKIHLLRQRLEMLDDQIEQVNARLNDPGFLSEAPDELVSEHRRRLAEMQREGKAIARILKKLGQ